MEASDRDAVFREFVAARYASLVRFGYLLTGDRGQGRGARAGPVAARVRRLAWRTGSGQRRGLTRKIMVRLSVRWRRRPWRGELPVGLVPEAAAADQFVQSDLAASIRRALQQLPAHQRAAVVLRYYVDLTPPEAADVLVCHECREGLIM